MKCCHYLLFYTLHQLSARKWAVHVCMCACVVCVTTGCVKHVTASVLLVCVCELGEDKEGKEQQLLQSKNEKVREAGRDNKWQCGGTKNRLMYLKSHCHRVERNTRQNRNTSFIRSGIHIHLAAKFARQKKRVCGMEGVGGVPSRKLHQMQERSSNTVSVVKQNNAEGKLWIFSTFWQKTRRHTYCCTCHQFNHELTDAKFKQDFFCSSLALITTYVGVHVLL